MMTVENLAPANLASENLAPEFLPLKGQDKAVLLLTQAVRQQRIAPAYGFMGMAGVGRRLAARCFAKFLLAEEGGLLGEMRSRCHHRIDQGNHPDVLWVEPTYLHQGQRLTVQQANEMGLKRKTPPQVRLEQIREISRFVARPPLEARRSLIIMLQAETMAEAAANALLKTLEEPGCATLILISPSPEALLPTLVSRCQTIPFVPLQPSLLAQILQQAGHGEITHNPTLMVLAQGSPGRAIQLWQSLQEIPEEILQITESLPHSPRQALELAARITKALDTEQQLWLLDYFQCQLWTGQWETSPQVDPSRPVAPTGVTQAPGWSPGMPYRPSTDLQLSNQIRLLETAKKQLMGYVQPLLVWEVLLLRLGEMIST